MGHGKGAYQWRLLSVMPSPNVQKKYLSESESPWVNGGGEPSACMQGVMVEQKKSSDSQKG